MNGKIEWNKNYFGENELVIKVNEFIIIPFLNELRDYLGAEYKLYNDNKLNEYDGYFISILNINDCNKIIKNYGLDLFNEFTNRLLNMEFDDIRLIGIGMVEKNENISYYIKVESEILESIKNIFEFLNNDLYITIGYKWRDVENVPRKNLLGKFSKFFKLLSIEYYNNRNWNFIKDIDNYSFNRIHEVIPVSNTETTIKFKVNGYYIDVTYLDDVNKFWVVTKYQIDGEELPRLSQSKMLEIIKK